MTNQSGLGLTYSDQDAESLTTALGAQAAYAISTSWGVLQPTGLFEWVHEYKADNLDSSVRFTSAQNVSNSSFTTSSPSPDRNFFNIGGGLSAIFPHGISTFAYFETVLGWDDFDSYLISVGIRKEL